MGRPNIWIRRHCKSVYSANVVLLLRTTVRQEWLWRRSLITGNTLGGSRSTKGCRGWWRQDQTTEHFSLRPKAPLSPPREVFYGKEKIDTLQTGSGTVEWGTLEWYGTGWTRTTVMPTDSQVTRADILITREHYSWNAYFFYRQSIYGIEENLFIGFCSNYMSVLSCNRGFDIIL